MPDLRRCFEVAGFSDVRTVLSSGNVAFSTRVSASEALERRAEQAMQVELELANQQLQEQSAELELQAEELLKTSWRLIHDANAPATVRSDLIKATMRWAGYDVKEAAVGSGGTALNIQINL